MESYSLYSWAMERQQEMLREAEDRRKVRAARQALAARVVPFPTIVRGRSAPAEEGSRQESA